MNNFNVEANAFLPLSIVMGKLIVPMDQMSLKVVWQIDYESMLHFLYISKENVPTLIFSWNYFKDFSHFED